MRIKILKLDNDSRLYNLGANFLEHFGNKVYVQVVWNKCLAPSESLP